MARAPVAKRRRLSPPGEIESFPESHAKRAKPSAADEWDEEQEYETKPRTHTKARKETTRLPIRTESGWVEQEREYETEESGVISDSAVDSEAEGDGDDIDEEREAVDEEPQIPHRLQVLQAKEELARLAALINEDPEEHIGSLRGLAEIGKSSNVTVKKLALAAQAAVYKDVIPGYRIRPLTDEDMKSKLSKEVRKLRTFEQSVVKNYQNYIHSLAECAKPSKHGSKEQSSLTMTAVSCASNLVVSVPHFNFRSELLRILVAQVSRRKVDAEFVKSRETLESLFRSDEDGYVTQEAVQMLTKMFKAKNYRVDESVLNTFLHLRLLSEFSYKASNTAVDQPTGENGDSSARGRKIKQKKEFLTKKQRKARRENKAISAEMREADATVSHEERDRMQAETLKLVFVTYFRILKAREPKLMGAVLEGLARYAHLINQDFFGDILEALKDLINDEATQSAHEGDEEASSNGTDEEIPHRDATRQSLLCVITAFALLQGQDATKAANTLHLDLTFFITHLYNTLTGASLNSDIELSARSLHLPDPGSSTSTHQQQSTPRNAKINVQTTSVLLLRSLSSVLLPSNVPARSVPPVRIAAFARNLLTASLHLPEKSCLAMMALMQKVVKVHGKRIGALWNTDERKGDGVWDPTAKDVERSNPFAGTSWEGELLRKHFCPEVREAIGNIEKGILGAR